MHLGHTSIRVPARSAAGWPAGRPAVRLSAQPSAAHECAPLREAETPAQRAAAGRWRGRGQAEARRGASVDEQVWVCGGRPGSVAVVEPGGEPGEEVGLVTGRVWHGGHGAVAFRPLRAAGTIPPPSRREMDRADDFLNCYKRMACLRFGQMLRRSNRESGMAGGMSFSGDSRPHADWRPFPFRARREKNVSWLLRLGETGRAAAPLRRRGAERRCV